MSLELAPRCLRPAMEPRLATMPEGAAAINLRHLYKRSTKRVCVHQTSCSTPSRESVFWRLFRLFIFDAATARAC